LTARSGWRKPTKGNQRVRAITRTDLPDADTISSSRIPSLSPVMKNRPASKGPAKPGGKVFSELLGPGNYPLAYYNMPKAACTTIKNLLYYIKNGDWYPDPLDIHQGIRLKGILLRNREFMLQREEANFERPFMVFTFVREPGRRVYSTFVEKFWATGKYSFTPFRKHLQQRFDYTLPPLENGGFSLEEVRVAFKQFLQFAELNLAGQTHIPPNAHWASQFQRVRKLKPADHVSFIGRVESFASDMAFVLSKAGWTDLSITEGPAEGWETVTAYDNQPTSDRPSFMKLEVRLVPE
jgi:hypothetical protein